MKRRYQEIQWSREMRMGFNEAKRKKIEKSRKELDREIESNMMIQQKIIGAVMALLAIVVATILSAVYGQTEYYLLALLFVGFGIWLILTKENTIKNNREELRRTGWRTYMN